eukprot:TRINITY_DN82527_c1_g1_i1.p3 TRINITY_DN82527_c1_g1~~TRINITY_DN82527_c1_g1_i1.p3  ORF type:complete len:109 (+),score=28.85 TRINITY_DN82527_c1_g1_i1:102-428(+)
MQQQQQQLLLQQLQQNMQQQRGTQESPVFELMEGETYGVPVAPPVDGDENGVDESAMCYGQRQAAMIAYYQMWMCSLFGANQMNSGGLWGGNTNGIKHEKQNRQNDNK